MDVKLPAYLERKKGVRVIDRGRLCPHRDLDEQRTCTTCHATGLRPGPELSPDAKALGCEPLPDDHEARFSETFVVGMSE